MTFHVEPHPETGFIHVHYHDGSVELTITEHFTGLRYFWAELGRGLDALETASAEAGEVATEVIEEIEDTGGAAG